jgi:hypothetical protein
VRAYAPPPVTAPKLAEGLLITVIVFAAVFAFGYYGGCLPGKHRRKRQGRKR